jgi:hypothetical protein
VAGRTPARKTAPKRTGAARGAAKPKATGELWKVAPAGGRHYGGGSTPTAAGAHRKLPSPTAGTTKIKVANPAPKPKAKPAAKPVAKARAAKNAGEAAGDIAAGGGPEDPVGDFLALKKLRKAWDQGSGVALSAGGKVAAGNRLLLAEFVICLTILGLGTIIAPSGTNQASVSRLMVKSSAFAGIFLILALTAATGPKASKAAAGLGGLVTVAYVVTSPDAIAIFKWLGGGFSTLASSGGTTATEAGPAAATAASAANVAVNGLTASAGEPS